MYSFARERVGRKPPTNLCSTLLTAGLYDKLCNNFLFCTFISPRKQYIKYFQTLVFGVLIVQWVPPFYFANFGGEAPVVEVEQVFPLNAETTL